MNEEKTQQKYHKGKKIVWLEDEYHRLLKIMAVQNGNTIKKELENLVEDTWINKNKK